MGIQFDPNATSVNWGNLLNKLAESAGPNGVQVSEANRSVTFSANVDGVESRITVRIPDDLDLTGAVDEAAIASLVEKLSDASFGLTEEQIAAFKEQITKIYKDMSVAVASVKSTSTGSVMFDLYRLMALLVEVAQSQRDAARQLRTAQSEQIQNSIQSQADTQRNAAMVGLIVGVVCGAISAIVSGVMLGMQGAAYKNQLSAARSSGADAAQTNADMIKSADTSAHADAQLRKVEGQVGERIATDVKGQMDGQVANARDTYVRKSNAVINKQQDYDTARNDLSAARADRSAKQTAVADAQRTVDAARAEAGIENAQRSATGAKADYIRECFGRHEAPADERLAKFDTAIRAEADLQSARTALGGAPTEEAIAGMELAVSNANDALQTAKTEQQTARADYRAALKTAADGYADRYEAAVAADGPNAESAVKARSEMRMARAYSGSKLAEEGVTTAVEHRQDLAAAREGVDQANKRLNANADYRNALHNGEVYTGVNAINTAIGSMLQGMTQNITGMINAEATRKGAEQEQEKDQLEQTKDLFGQAQNLVDSVVQLMQAVAAAESQSMRDAIQA